MFGKAYAIKRRKYGRKILDNRNRKLVAFSANFPDTDLTSYQMKAVKETILTRVLKLEDGGYGEISTKRLSSRDGSSL